MSPRSMPDRATPVRRRLATLACATALMLAVGGCSTMRGSAGDNFVTPDRSITQIAPGDRGRVVALDGTDLSGEPVSLASMRGRPTVVNVWGAWCGPCQKEAPLLVDAKRTLGDRAHFLGIDSRDAGTAAGRTFQARNDITWPSLFSPGGEAVLAFNGLVSPRGVPTTVLLDADGRAAAVFSGEIPSALTLVQMVRQVARGG
jgi:thiol-disulfide isomerase/thioredoxin